MFPVHAAVEEVKRQQDKYTTEQLVYWLSVGPLADMPSPFQQSVSARRDPIRAVLTHARDTTWAHYIRDYADRIWSAVDEIVSGRIFGDAQHCAVCGGTSSYDNNGWWFCSDCAPARRTAAFEAPRTCSTDPIQFILRARRALAKMQSRMQPPVPQPTPAPVEQPKPEPVKCWKCGKPDAARMEWRQSWCAACWDNYLEWANNQNSGFSAPAWLVKQQLEAQVESLRGQIQRERWLGNLPGRKPRLLGTCRGNPFDPREE